MAEIYRIGSDDLVDRVSTFGGTNLALATSYDQFGIDTYATKENVTFLGDNKVKIEAGGELNRGSSKIITNFPDGNPQLFSGNYIISFYVYENTLNQNGSFAFYKKHNASSAGGQVYTLSAQKTGLFTFLHPLNNSYYGFYGRWYFPNATSGYIIISPLKFEKGTKATDWTPSPYDLVTYDSSNESLVFFQ